MEKKPLISEKIHSKSCLVCGSAHGLNKNGGGFVACRTCGLEVCGTCYEFLSIVENQSCPKCLTPYKRHEGSVKVSSDGDRCTTDTWETNSKSTQTSESSRKEASNMLHCSEDYQNGKDKGVPNDSRKVSEVVDVPDKRTTQKDKRVYEEPSTHPLYSRVNSFPPSSISGDETGRVSSASRVLGIGASRRLSVQASLPRHPEESWFMSSRSLRERLMQWKLAQEAAGHLSVQVALENYNEPSSFMSSRSLRERLLQWKLARETAGRLSVQATLENDPETSWLMSSKSLRERLLQWKLAQETADRLSVQTKQERDPESSWHLSSKSLRERLLKWKRARETAGRLSVQATEGNDPESSWLLSSKSLRERLLKWRLAQENRNKKESQELNGSGSIKEEELYKSEIDIEHRQHLSRKTPIRRSKINPFRVIILFRLVITAFFLWYRLVNPVRDAYRLWLTSVLCELWFSAAWILDQLPKWHPVSRETYLERLCLRYNFPGKKCQLACIDIFVSTVDSVKEPPLITANSVLSILSVDYPADKVSCYVSDDGASLLMLETLLETCEFARKWVPFCKRFDIEPRSPEQYFSQKIENLKYNIFPTFTKERRAMKRQYEEFKILVNDLESKLKNVPSGGYSMKDGTPWPGNNTRDHPGMIQILMRRGRLQASVDKELPQLVYMSREKHPRYDHNKKAGAMNALVRVSAVITNAPYILNLDCNHYINNSKALLEAMCFMMDPSIMDKVCYVQFPLRFDGIDATDRYANHNTIFYDVTMKGLDGIQGPLYVGTGCFFNRKALYGYEPLLEPKWCRMRNKVRTKHSSYYSSNHDLSKESSSLLGTELSDLERQLPSAIVGLEKCFGQSAFFLSSTLVEDDRLSRSASPDSLLREAIHVLSCDFEDNTTWGREIGWMYGSLTGDILTGFKMHARGWRSIYCMPSHPAFRGSAPINLSDRLNQVLRWAFGSVEIFFSCHCPIWYGSSGRLKWLQRVGYINATIYPLTSIPLVIYCTLPAVCLLTGKFIIPSGGNLTSIWLPILFLSFMATCFLEIRWSQVRTQEWWRNQQFWVIAGVSSHLFSVFQGLVKAVGGMNIYSTVMTKRLHDDEFLDLFAFKWTSLLILPTTLILINGWAMVAGTYFVINNGYGTTGLLFGKLFFAFWVLLHLYPFLKGLLIRRHRIPSVVIVWSLLLATLFSVLWVRVNPFSTRYRGPNSRDCGINC